MLALTVLMALLRTSLKTVAKLIEDQDPLMNLVIQAKIARKQARNSHKRKKIKIQQSLLFSREEF